MYVFSHLFYHPSPLLSGNSIVRIDCQHLTMGLSFGRAYKMCTFYECVYAVHFHDIYFMPTFFRLNILPNIFYSMHTFARAHALTHRNHFFSFLFYLSVCFWVIFVFRRILQFRLETCICV